MLGDISPTSTTETLFPKRHGSLSCPAHEWSGIIFQFIVIRQCVIGEGEGGEPQSRFAVALGFLTAESGCECAQSYSFAAKMMIVNRRRWESSIQFRMRAIDCIQCTAEFEYD